MAMRPTINRHQLELDEYAFALNMSSGRSSRLEVSGLGDGVNADRWP
jgi:hypothetical protein